MRILLLRHAEPDYTVDSLTPKGRKEAALLSRRMVRYRIRDFYVSPLGRARDTAAYTLNALNRCAETLPWLAEFRARVPDSETGSPRLPWDLPPLLWSSDPLLQDYSSWTKSPLYEGGNVAEIWAETTAGVDALLARYGLIKDGPIWRCENNSLDTIALFCHFGISMAVLGYLMNISPAVLWHRVLCYPSSLTEVVTEERIPGQVFFRATRIGDITHLESEGEPRSSAGLFPECYTGIDSTDPDTNGSDRSRNP